MMCGWPQSLLPVLASQYRTGTWTLGYSGYLLELLHFFAVCEGLARYYMPSVDKLHSNVNYVNYMYMCVIQGVYMYRKLVLSVAITTTPCKCACICCCEHS